MALGILNFDTIRSLLVIILIIWVFSGKATRVVANLLRKFVGLES